MDDQTVTIATMALYMGICLWLGIVAWRRTRDLGDYILGGRSLGSWVTALSAQATDMSGWLLMGLPGLAYASGFDSVWLLGGLAVGTWLNWRYVAAPLRAATERLGDALTLPDYFERRFDDRSRILRTLTAVPIVMLTARADEADRLAGLEQGADDYIGKNPFSPREVVARVKAVLRRSRGAPAATASAETTAVVVTPATATPLAASSTPLRVDVPAWRASWQGRLLDLTPNEFQLLRILAAQPGRVYARSQLLNLLHGDARPTTERAVDSHVKNLRRKLAAAGAGTERIRSVYGVGYCYDA
jgi:two-component system response regulator BaeR